MSSGKWYYEVEILTPGSVKLGWALTEASPDSTLGGDESSWAYDGFTEEKIYGGVNDSYGKKWSVGDTVGVFLDTNDRTIGKIFSKCCVVIHARVHYQHRFIPISVLTPSNYTI